jgi:alpha-tubulin suppressor-like RCC1 family protein
MSRFNLRSLIIWSCATLALALGACSDESGSPTTTEPDEPGKFGPFAYVSAGWRHTCGLSSTGNAYCWGKGTDRGQLGQGDYSSSLTPVAVVGGLIFGSVSAGGLHTCGLTNEGRAYCWGTNTNGQLGTGNTLDTNRPVPVATDLTFTSIGAGGAHTCGITADGQVFCWGANNSGQLGIGDTKESHVSVQVTGLPGARQLSVGWGHNCVLTTNAAARCWGQNSNGQLGNGTTTDSSGAVEVVGGLTFSTVTVTGVGSGAGNLGQNHTCGLTTSGEAYCWGDNYHNALGTNGARTSFSSPQRVQGVPTFVDIVTGGDIGCGVTSAGVMWCWGDNLRGQLGNGPREDYNPAITVAGAHSFAQIAAGWDHTCGVTSDGEAYCWGWNHRGQVGDGTDEPHKERPVPVVTANVDP